MHNGPNPFSFSFLGSVVGNRCFEVPSWNSYLEFGFGEQEDNTCICLEDRLREEETTRTTK